MAHREVVPDPSTSATTLSLGVSIVLYRTPLREILKLVQQLLQQGANLIYLVDNSPASFDTFSGWTPPDRVITISTRRNLGYGRANNLAIRDSVRRHKYHIVCNPDITLGVGLLPDLYDYMELHPEVGLCGPRVLAPDGTLQYLCKRAPSLLDLFVRRFAPRSWFTQRRVLYEMRDHSYEHTMEPTSISGCFMYLRSNTLAALSGFDERFFLYLEDLDLSRRAKHIAKNIYYPWNHVIHVHQRGAYKSLRLLLHFGISVARYFHKWGFAVDVEAHDPPMRPPADPVAPSQDG